MAKRSDFAQKLLDDLRLRKERLAASQSSSHSHYKTGGDAHGYSRQTYRGSSQNRVGALRSANTHSRSSGGQKSLYSGEASNQIVAFRRGQSSQQIGDLSMALALAVENGGKFRRMDSSGNSSMLTFLHQIGRGSVEVNQMERTNSMDRRQSSTIRVPNLSQFHIKEISKGAQKLNQILRAWSSGVNLDRYSIEIGKELLKGAMDLEESLRMLVDLEDASEFMTEPQRKNRLVLLDDDDDGDEGDVIKSTEQKQLVLPPKFSFDDPTRRSRRNQEVKAIQKPGLPALTYPTEATSFHYKEQTHSHVKTASHKRSTSFGNNTRNLTPLQEQANLSNSLQTKSEKRKMSNVIAKLMGLEEFPENPDPRFTREKDKSSNQTSDRKLLKKSTQGSTGNVEPKTRDAPNLPVPSIQTTQLGKSLLTQDITSIVLGAEKRLATNSVRSELVSSTEKLPWKETQKVNSETKKERINTDPINQNSGDQKRRQEAERKKDVKTMRGQKGAEIGENKGQAYNDELYHVPQRTPRKNEFGPTLQEKMGYKERKLKMEKRNADVLFPVHPQKPHRDNGFEQSFELQRPEPPEEKRMRVEMKSQDVQSKGSEIVHKASPKPVQEEVLSFQRKNLHLDQSKPQKFVPADSIYDAQANKLPDQSRPRNRVPRRVKSESGKGRKNAVPVVEEKRILEPAPRARKATELLKNKMPRKLNELKKKSGALHNNLVKPLPQASYREGAKQIRSARLDGSVETEQVKTDKSAHREHNVKPSTAEASLQWLTNAHERQKEAEQLAPAYACDVDETPELEEARNFPYDLNQNVSSVLLNEPHVNSGEFGRDEELMSATIISEPADGTAGVTTYSHHLDKSEDGDISKSGIQEKMTECEKHLKHILMKSQLFLNTAEALFNLDSPAAFLHVSDENSLEDNDKLILDCGYEIMKRKGRRQELAVHPFMKISVAFVRVRTFDDLVQQLNQNFNVLKLHGRNGNPECEPEYYLPNMLEVDVNVSDPDTNCMWDFGWNDAMFAFLEKDDVVRDVEKQVISGLIDEMTRDLLNP